MRRISIASWILIGMVAGSLFGYLAPAQTPPLAIVTSIFLRLIRSIIAPVLFGVLVRGLAEAGTGRELGRIGWRAVVYFEIVSGLALLTGWFACLIVKPGAGISLGAVAAPGASGPTPTFTDVLVSMFPASIIDAMARGDVLQITLFSILFGLACAAIGLKSQPVVRFAGAIADVAFHYTSYVMYLAPAAVFAAMATTVAQNGGQGALGGLARFVATAWAAQIVFFAVALLGSVWLAGLSLRKFARETQEPFLTGFATTSSAAAIPQILAALRRLGVPEKVVGIVTPLSLSFNATGSCIHLAMGALFTAQAAGISLSLTQQLLILGTLKLTSKGVVGIPRANFIVLAGLFGAFGLPMEGLTVLLGLDALIDPVRTGVNVLGHCAGPPLIARWEGSGLEAQTLAPDVPVRAA
ncbi:MAG: dicarboxylate/amino acid:cation symporter [Bryobacteraceae bacterium]|nr:dicarboxylate/amino acid:cation symporter [Bryobacteraceae bacterium]